MGGQPCKQKILLNGRTIESEAGYLADAVQEPSIEIPDDAGYKIVELLNTAEDAVFQAKRAYLESQDFNGPWPHSMSDKADSYRKQ
jgi:hypothetical protein